MKFNFRGGGIAQTDTRFRAKGGRAYVLTSGREEVGKGVNPHE